MTQNNTTAAHSTQMETLENRQFFTACPATPVCPTTVANLGTLNVSFTTQKTTALVDYTRNGIAEQMGCGAFAFTRSATDGGTYAGKWANDKSIETYCIEPDQELNWTSVFAFKVTDLASSPPQASTNGPLGCKKADQIRELWGRFHSQIGTDANKSAAFQMAIWEIACDSDRNLSKGTFKMDGTTANDKAVKAQAQCWLNQITGCGTKANLLAMTSITDQDQVFEIPCPQPKLCTPTKRGNSTSIGCNSTLQQTPQSCLDKATTSCHQSELDRR